MKAWLSLPYHQAYPWFVEAEEEYLTAFVEFDGVLTGGLMSQLDPTMGQTAVIWERGNQLDRRIKMMIGVEALRDYAARNNGKLPEELETDVLPIPFDPGTGLPFIYSINEESAAIESLGTRRGEKEVFRFELTLKKVK